MSEEGVLPVGLAATPAGSALETLPVAPDRSAGADVSGAPIRVAHVLPLERLYKGGQRTGDMVHRAIDSTARAMHRRVDGVHAQFDRALLSADGMWACAVAPIKARPLSALLIAVVAGIACGRLSRH